MRRIIAGLLFSVLIAQSSGVPAAAAQGAVPSKSIMDTLVALATPIHNLWLNSMLHASLTGQLDRWAAMHAPAPTFPHVTRIPRPPGVSMSQQLRPRVRGGRPVAVPGLKFARAIDPRKAPRDPLAMPHANGSLRLALSSRFSVSGRMHAMSCGPMGCTPTPSPTPSPTPTLEPTACPTGDSGIPPNCTTATPTPSPTPGLSAPTTGINHYWTYEEKLIPGLGTALINVGNGNLLVQASDVDIPGRGIDLAFQRTYNSQSTHDANNTDASTPSVFGNGWTSTFDAHLAYNSTYGIISVYDTDGARYDYRSNGQGQWIAPAGQYAKLTLESPESNGDGQCAYNWTKKNGAVYYFEAPTQLSTCNVSIPSGMLGRIVSISGRNSNNSLAFTYSWVNGNASNPENLTQILVEHSDGQSLTLAFGVVGGTGPTELTSITRPDGSAIAYSYSGTGNLTGVSRPGNQVAGVTPACTQTNAQCIPEMYTYESGTYLMQSADSPRYTVSYQNTDGSPTDGDAVNFAYNGSKQLTSLTDDGVVNFTPSDAGPQTVLQSGYSTGIQSWYTESFSGYSTGVTSVSDSDGHSRMWTFDGYWRVTQAQSWTGTQWLVSYKQWDTNDDLTQLTDERANVTTLSYDGNGNLIMAAQPSVTTSMGTFQPTAWYQYDQYNNLVYYCDPNWVDQNGGNYPNGSNPCTGTPSGVAHYTWNYTVTQEPFGQLSDTYTPLGYHRHLTYDANGMTLSVVGDTIDQADGTQRTPDLAFTYDTYGDVKTYNPGNGTWQMTYDTMNRLTERTDPDSINSYISYYPDSSTYVTETAFQHALTQGTGSEIGVIRAYDVDGDETQETHHYGGTINLNTKVWTGTPGVTHNFYDGYDRLVEVEQAADSNYDEYTNPWITRYLYDLSQDGTLGTLSFNSNGAQPVSYSAHGNIFKTVELLPSGTSPLASQGGDTIQHYPNTQYQDIKGAAYDPLDRPTDKYSIYANGASADLSTETLTYDTNPPVLGFLGSDCNAQNVCEAYSYEARGKLSEVSSSGQPVRIMTYDPDGRTTSINDDYFGAESYTYDSDGRLITSQDPANYITSPALLTHHYYADGMEESLDIASSALTQIGFLTDSYRSDGLLQTQVIDDASVSGILNAGSTTVAYTYTAAGRMSERTESGAASNGTPTTVAYDPTYGYQTSITAPSATLSSTYDAEEELLGGFDIRGELVQSAPPGLFLFANGLGTGFSSLTTETWDDRNAIALETSTSGVGITSSSTYNIAGQLTSDTVPATYTPPSPAPTATPMVTTRSYDQENRTVSTSVTHSMMTQANIIKWGPNSHPIEIDSDSLHWNGDQLLFTTNSSGQLDDIKIGASGDILPKDTTYNGLTFFDRGPDSSAFGCHNASGAASSGVPAPYTQSYNNVLHGVSFTAFVSPCAPPKGNTSKMPVSILWWASPPSPGYGVKWPSVPGAGGVLGMPRADGLADGTDHIQGVRAYDPNVGTWTTPDAYSGDIDDPTAQKSYMWNFNNPIVYSDPTGYDVECTNAAGKTCIQIDNPPPVACPNACIPTDPLLGVYVSRRDVVGAASAFIAFRAVSSEEFEDIQQNGFRPNPNGDGYQFCKLFFLNLCDAVRFGEKYNQPNVVGGRIPDETPLTNPDMNGPEGPAVGVPSEHLPNVEPIIPGAGDEGPVFPDIFPFIDL